MAISQDEAGFPESFLLKKKKVKIVIVKFNMIALREGSSERPQGRDPLKFLCTDTLLASR